MKLEKKLYYLTAFFCTLGALAHELVGAPSFLPPLLKVQLTDEAIWLLHFSWHSGSVTLIGITLLFLHAARNKGNYTVAFIASLTMGGFAAVVISLATFGNSVLWSTPAPYLWTCITFLGFAGGFVEKNSIIKP